MFALQPESPGPQELANEDDKDNSTKSLYFSAIMSLFSFFSNIYLAYTLCCSPF